MLDVRLDGEVIATIEEQALAVRIQTSRGETSATGLGPDDGVIDLIIDRVPPGGPPRLDQLEAQTMQDIRDRSPEGTVIGFARDHQVHPSGLSATQGTHTETLREGGVDTELTRRTRSNGQVPQVDLAEGLQAGDVEVRSARLTAFAEHGDAQRAIDDNPADGSGGSSGQDGGGTINEDGTSYESLRSSDDTSSNPSPPVGAGSDEAPTSGDDASSSGPGEGSSSEDDPRGAALRQSPGTDAEPPQNESFKLGRPSEPQPGDVGGTKAGSGIKLPGSATKASGTTKKS